MTILEHWQLQKDNLRLQLEAAPTMADAVYQLRHAMVQTEQNALAEMGDDVLRQQAGVLFGCVKHSLGLVECCKAIATPQWNRKKVSHRSPRLLLGLLAVLPLLVLTALCWWKGFVAGMALGLCTLLVGTAALLWKPEQETAIEAAIVLRPDIDRLFTLLDGQMRSIDRCVNDFDYLNEQLCKGVEPTDARMVDRAADLMEALMECDEEQGAPAMEAADRLLSALGMRAVLYSEENSRLFNILPSKNTTCTLSPAIVSAQDKRMLRRGTAAVCTDAA